MTFSPLPVSKPIIIAGPCSAETEEQTLETAHTLKRAGIGIFRAGVWKPRTKPGGFEGVGEKALGWLRRVRQETGMLTATEVANATHVRAAVAAGIDILWVGARTTTNPFAVQEVADTLSELAPDTPVLVKNPVNPDLELWIGGIERFYNAGVRCLGAVHRGFSSYSPGEYRNEPHWRIPLELRRRLPDLPLICDPSHIGGRRDLIEPIAQRALDMGLDGLIIETHPHPDGALSDASQQITPSRLSEILPRLEMRSRELPPEEELADLRASIDRLDSEWLEIMARRMDISKRIGEYKKEGGVAIVQPARYADVVASRVEAAERLGLNADFVRTLLSAIHEESVRLQLSR